MTSKERRLIQNSSYSFPSQQLTIPYVSSYFCIPWGVEFILLPETYYAHSQYQYKRTTNDWTLSNKDTGVL